MGGFNRRDFLRASALAVGTIVVSSGLQGCLSSSSSSSDDEAVRGLAFEHGVASGDPLSDRVLLWTRITPTDGNNAEVQIGWEIATDSAFTDLVHSGTASTNAARDFTLKVDAQDLLPGTSYYFRFKVAGLTSPVGRCKTLPAGSIDQVRFAVLSCSNYPAGLFHVYAAAAAEAELDAVLHLGDYIYEYGNGGYATEDAADRCRAGAVAQPGDSAAPIHSSGAQRHRRQQAPGRRHPGHHPAHAVPLDRMSTAVQDGRSLGYSRPSSIPPRLRSTLWQAPCG